MPNPGSLGGGGGVRRNGPAVRPAGLPGGGSAGRTAGRVGSGGPAGRLGRPKCRPAVRPAESAGRHRRRAEPPEPNRPSRTAAEGTAGSFRPTSTLYSSLTISKISAKTNQHSEFCFFAHFVCACCYPVPPCNPPPPSTRRSPGGGGGGVTK